MSAPSDTSTTPATGRPASSSRTPSSAAPSLRLRSAEGQLLRRTRRASRWTRTGTPGPGSDPTATSAAGCRAAPNCCLDECAARLARPSRESACCASRPGARPRRSAGRPRRGRRASDGTGRRARAPAPPRGATVRTMRSRRRPSFDADAAVGAERPAPTTTATTSAATSDAVGDVEAELTLLKDDRPIREECLEQRFEHRQAPPKSGLTQEAADHTLLLTTPTMHLTPRPGPRPARSIRY